MESGTNLIANMAEIEKKHIEKKISLYLAENGPRDLYNLGTFSAKHKHMFCFLVPAVIDEKLEISKLVH